MVPISALWLPILLSAVAVFLVSSLIHTALPIHKNDFKKVPDEDALQDAFRRLGIAPGDYAVPNAGSSQGMKEPGFVERMARGPLVFMTVIAGGHSFMGTSLALWLVQARLGDHAEVDVRRPDLRFVDGGDVRLALAAMSRRATAR